MNELALLVYVVLQLLDAYTTHTALGQGKREANPIMRKVFEELGVTEGLVLTKFIGIAIGVMLYEQGVYYALYALTAIYAAVVINNFKHMEK